MRNPLIDLPEPFEEVIKNIEAIILTHTHLDHWDPVAAKLIPKYIPVFVQYAADKKLEQSMVFMNWEGARSNFINKSIIFIYIISH